MDKWTFRYVVTRDLMLFDVALKAPTLYPRRPVIFLVAVPVASASMLHLFEALRNWERVSRSRTPAGSPRGRILLPAVKTDMLE
jgi:hypothetical protein